MKFIDTIKKRRSIRKFLPIQIPRSMIEDLIQCASLAPSAKNRQPWQFIVISSQRKKEIADMMIRQLKNSHANENQFIYSSVRHTAAIIDQSSDLILVVRQKDDFWRYSDTLSIGAAVENICLRAVDQGLGTLWIGDMVFIENEILQFLNLENLELVCGIAVGFPNESPKARPRKPLHEILLWMDS